jgi:catechol 2,3-dioxygenase
MAVQQESSQKVAFKPRRLGHVNLFVRDLDRSMDFYINVFGIEMVRRETEIKAGFLSNGNTHHDVAVIEAREAELLGLSFKPEPGLNHLGWELENEADLVDAHNRAVEAGIKVDLLADHQISYGVYFSDPEGNGQDLYADAMEDWRVIMRPDLDDLITSQWIPGEKTPSTQAKYLVNPELRRVEGAVFHPVRTAQAAFTVRDMDEMVSYYEDVIGLHEIERAPNDSSVVMGGTIGERSLTLVQAAEGEPTGLHHFSFEVANEVELDQAEVEMKKKGIQAEKRIDNAKRRSVFVRDPDSLLVEFYADR